MNNEQQQHQEQADSTKMNNNKNTSRLLNSQMSTRIKMHANHLSELREVQMKQGRPVFKPLHTIAYQLKIQHLEPNPPTL